MLPGHRSKRERDDDITECWKRPCPSPSPSTLLEPRGALPFPHRLVAAPLVGASDFAFRALCHRHGADLCYTEMLHSDLFLQREYRQKMLLNELAAPHETMPLVVQLCGTDPDTVLAAARLAVQEVPGCCCIDLNLGCPQRRALDGGYGAFTPHQTALAVVAMLSDGQLGVPVSCKIRLVDGDLENTVRYARQLQGAGCNMLAVHGRYAGTGNQRRRRSGAADLEAIKCVKEAVSIPVLTNGNVKVYDDISKNLKYTGADGAMVGEALLGNPAIFELCGTKSRALGWKNPAIAEPPDPPGMSKRDRQQLRQRWRLWLLAREYLDLAKQHPAPEPMAYVRAHVRWMLGKRKAGTGSRSVYTHCGEFTQDRLREELDSASDLETFRQIVDCSLGQGFSQASGHTCKEL